MLRKFFGEVYGMNMSDESVKARCAIIMPHFGHIIWRPISCFVIAYSFDSSFIEELYNNPKDY